MLRRITDSHGRGVELDDTNATHLAWAIKAVLLIPRKATGDTKRLRNGLEAFIEGARASLRTNG